MAVPLVILPQAGDPRPRRELLVTPGTRMLAAAHEAGIDITATCGGRGRCTSCRVRFVEGTIPPPTVMDQVAPISFARAIGSPASARSPSG
jgi:ferredoxin